MDFDEVPEFDLADRMRKALRTSHVGVQEMADYLGVARNTVSTWINGKIQPSMQTVRLWALRTGVPYVWLKDGRPHESPHPAGPEGGHVAATNDYSLQGTSGVVVPFPQVTGPESAPYRRAA